MNRGNVTMKCAVMFGGNNGSEPRDLDVCVLPQDHDGPHQFTADDGRSFHWETDLECDCAHCMQTDGDYCAIYWLTPNVISA